MQHPNIESYKTQRGNSVLYKYLKKLPRKSRMKLMETIHKIHEKGPLVARDNRWLDDARKGSGFVEIRSSFNKNQRRVICFLDKEANTYVAVDAFDKKVDKIQNSDLNVWTKRRKDYQTRKEQLKNAKSQRQELTAPIDELQ